MSTLCCYKCTSNQHLVNDHHLKEHNNNNNSKINLNNQTPIALSQNSLNIITSQQNISLSDQETNELLSNNENITNNKTNLNSINNYLELNNNSNNLNVTRDSASGLCIVNSPLPQVSSSAKDLPFLYPPGRILHVVRKYPRSQQQSNNVNSNKNRRLETSSTNLKKQNPFNIFNSLSKKLMRKKKNENQTITSSVPVYQVIETDNHQFNELLISPRMLQDHMPDNLIKCMKAVLEDRAPKKPPRQFTNDSNSDDEDNDFKEICSLNINNQNLNIITNKLENEYDEINNNNNNTNNNSNNNIIIENKKTQNKFYSNLNNLKKNVTLLKQYGQTFLTRTPSSIKKSEAIVNKVTKSSSASSLINKSKVITVSPVAAAAPAPLAKPESISDFLNSFEDEENENEDNQYDNVSTDIKTNENYYSYLNTTNLNPNNRKDNLTYDLYYDDSINIKNPAFHLHYNKLNTTSQQSSKIILNDGEYFSKDDENNDEEEEIKWWPYHQNEPITTSTNNNTNNIIITSLNSNSNGANLEDNFNEDEDESVNSNNQSVDIIGSSSRSVNEENENENNTNNNNNNNGHTRIATSTPRGQSKKINKRYTNDISNDSVTVENDIQNKNHHDDSMLSSSTRSLLSSNNKLNIVINNSTNSSNFNNESNLDSSSSISFNHPSNNNNNTNNNNNRLMIQKAKISNQDESINTNYPSIEKLAIIKPQSKDYILCFDTSSIDQNSTNDSFDKNIIPSTTKANSLFNKSELINGELNNELEDDEDDDLSDRININFNNSLSSDGCGDLMNYETFKSKLISSSNNNDEEDILIKNNSSVCCNYPDSGVDSARTLSPQGTNQTQNQQNNDSTNNNNIPQ